MFIYRTTNTVNGKMYVGLHNGAKKDYIGSGLLLKQAIAKYGKESFTREILETCSTDEELRAAEIKWINELNCIDSDEYYNIAKGGRGGDTGVRPDTKLHKKSIKASWDKYSKEEKEARGKILSKARLEQGTAKGNKNPNASKIEVNNVAYDTIKDAAKALNIPYSSMKTAAQNGKSKKYNLIVEYV